MKLTHSVGAEDRKAASAEPRPGPVRRSSKKKGLSFTEKGSLMLTCIDFAVILNVCQAFFSN